MKHTSIIRRRYVETQVPSTSHPACYLQQSRGKGTDATAVSLLGYLYRYCPNPQESHTHRICQPDQASGVGQGSHSQRRDGKRYLPDEFLSAWYLIHRPGSPPQIRPQGRLSSLHPKQDQTAPHHPMGEGDAGVIGKVSGADRLLTISLPLPC